MFREMCGKCYRGWTRLKWHSNVEEMGEERMITEIYRSKVEDERLMERPRRGWRDTIKEATSQRSKYLEGQKGVYGTASGVM